MRALTTRRKFSVKCAHCAHCALLQRPQDPCLAPMALPGSKLQALHINVTHCGALLCFGATFWTGWKCRFIGKSRCGISELCWRDGEWVWKAGGVVAVQILPDLYYSANTRRDWELNQWCHKCQRPSLGVSVFALNSAATTGTTEGWQGGQHIAPDNILMWEKTKTIPLHLLPSHRSAAVHGNARPMIETYFNPPSSLLNLVPRLAEHQNI